MLGIAINLAHEWGDERCVDHEICTGYDVYVMF